MEGSGNNAGVVGLGVLNQKLIEEIAEVKPKFL
jgi:hypothetical protein